jgi:flagellar basal-body rod modification protein FlgD
MTIASTPGTTNWSSILANSTVPATGAVAGATTGTSAGTTGSAQNLASTFLTLLVAQLNNQDPLNPVDNSQLTTQMAQISTVTGINNLNTSVTNLMAQLQQSSAIQSAQLTGHAVMVAGSNLALNSGTAASGAATLAAVGGYSLSGAAQNVSVTVSDSSGTAIRTIQLGPQAAGFQDFTWDGTTDAGATAAAGNYQFTVTATASTGAAVTAAGYNLQPIVGAVPQPDGSTQLMLGNGSQVAYSAVKQII